MLTPAEVQLSEQLAIASRAMAALVAMRWCVCVCVLVC